MKLYEQPILVLMPLVNEDLLTVSDPFGDDVFNDQD